MPQEFSSDFQPYAHQLIHVGVEDNPTLVMRCHHVFAKSTLSQHGDELKRAPCVNRPRRLFLVGHNQSDIGLIPEQALEFRKTVGVAVWNSGRAAFQALPPVKPGTIGDKDLREILHIGSSGPRRQALSSRDFARRFVQFINEFGIREAQIDDRVGGAPLRVFEIERIIAYVRIETEVIYDSGLARNCPLAATPSFIPPQLPD